MANNDFKIECFFGQCNCLIDKKMEQDLPGSGHTSLLEHVIFSFPKMIVKILFFLHNFNIKKMTCDSKNLNQNCPVHKKQYYLQNSLVKLALN